MLAVPEFTFWSGPSRESSRSSLLLSYDGVRQPQLADATHEDVRRRYPCVSNSTAETPAIVSIVDLEGNLQPVSPHTNRRSIDDRIQ
jgi:hypothetical protein